MIVEPYDDPSIDNDDLLVRRINPEQHVVEDGNTGELRLSSMAFKASSTGSEGMSVDLKSEIEAGGNIAEEYVIDPKYLGAVEFPANVPRDVDLIVGKEPIPGNPFHGEVWRIGTSHRFTKAQQKALQNGCRWLVEINGVTLNF